MEKNGGLWKGSIIICSMAAEADSVCVWFQLVVIHRLPRIVVVGRIRKEHIQTKTTPSITPGTSALPSKALGCYGTPGVADDPNIAENSRKIAPPFSHTNPRFFFLAINFCCFPPSFNPL